MIKRSTWYVVAFSLVFLIIIFLISNNRQEDEAQAIPTLPPVEKAIPTNHFSQLQSISFRDPRGEKLVLNNKNGDWSIFSDPAKVNQARVEELLANLESLEVKARPDNPKNIEDLGINPNGAMLSLTDSQGENTRINIGMLSPTGSGYYIQVNNNAPVLVSKGGLETIINLFNSENLIIQPFIAP
jgi:hypothetical protein